jgi:hypothetical protein
MTDEIENPFFDDWKDCLRAHYKHVIYERDDNNANSLETVLIDTGFAEEELRSLRTDILVEIGAVQPESELSAVDEVVSVDEPVETESIVVEEVQPVETVESELAELNIELDQSVIEDITIEAVIEESIGISVMLEAEPEAQETVVEAQEDEQNPRQMSLF